VSVKWLSARLPGPSKSVIKQASQFTVHTDQFLGIMTFPPLFYFLKKKHHALVWNREFLIVLRLRIFSPLKVLGIFMA
jgi:hypothetical protein